MTPSEVARIAHELERVHNPRAVRWEDQSPMYRKTATQSAELILAGRFDIKALFGERAELHALFAACMPPVWNDDEPNGEPDRKPGYKEKELQRANPALRELMQPGPCETITV